MAYVKVFVSDEQFKQLLQLAKVYQTSVATLLRPYVSGTVIQLWAAYADPNNVPLHQAIIKRAMNRQNATLEEITEWTGLDRAVVQTTLSELIEDEQVREYAGRGKIKTYFLQEATDAKKETPTRR